jgi:preprotein translocase subunit SecG
MLFAILLTVQIVLCLALIGVILLQRSEGGALGMGGGGGGGFMTARGAGDLLTRTTAILATLFFANCIALVVVGNMASGGRSLTDRNEVQAIDVTKSGQPAVPTPAPTVPGPATGQAAPSLDALQVPAPQVRGAQPLPTPEASRVDPALKTQPANPAQNANPAAPAQ